MIVHASHVWRRVHALLELLYCVESAGLGAACFGRYTSFGVSLAPAILSHMPFGMNSHSLGSASLFAFPAHA